ncbi:Nucleoporin nup84 [Malassezia pachydermatis]
MDHPDVPPSSFEAFADAYRAARSLDTDAQLSAEAGTALVFADVCAERARSAQDPTASDLVHALDDRDAEAWATEAHTWKLIHALFRFVLALSVLHRSERLVEPRLGLVSPPANQYETPLATIIREWLQEVLPVRHGVEVRKGYMPFTKNALRAEKRTQVGQTPLRRGREKLVQQLDPDAALRGPGAWDVEDVHYEKALLRHLFEYVRAGDLDLALDLCVQTSQPWRSASLRGAIFYHDPTLCPPSEHVTEPLGSRTRSIWRRIAKKAASNVALDPYERALYGALSGDLASVLAVSESWEERLWGYVNARFEQLLEQHVNAAMPSHTLADTLDSKCLAEDTTAESSESLDSIFEQLAQATPTASQDALDPYHIVQRAVITDSVPDLLARVNARLPEMEQLAPHVYARLVRFFAHLTLFCHLVHVPLPVPLRTPILNAYVGVLQRAGESSELVALYASSLEEDNANHVYADFLCAMDPDASLEDRRRALLQAQPHGLDPAVVARATMHMLSTELLPSLQHSDKIQAWNALLRPNERRLILAVDWLTFFEATYADAIHQINTLARVFMSTGRLHAAHSLLQRVPSDLLSALPSIPMASDELMELDHWRSYFDVLSKNVQVRGLWSDCALAESHAEQHAWTQALVSASEAARLANMELLELGWLQFPLVEPDTLRQTQLQEIRRKYIPEIVQSLHWMLVDTSQVIKENLAHALALPNLVADERLRLYMEFTPTSHATTLHPLRKYLDQVREASLIALDRRQDVFGCEHTSTV